MSKAREPAAGPASKDYRPSASREASYFHNEHDVQNGVIVECNWAKADLIKQTVVNFATHTSAYAMESCFKHREHAETRSQFYKDERPYEVFENVNYEANEVGMVTSRISRNQKKWECQNMGHDVFAVKAKCVFSFKDKRCDTDIIENVDFDPAIFHTQVLCQNVTFNCWLQFIFTKSAEIKTENPELQRIRYKLHSLEEVNPEAFDFARGASWSKNKPFSYDDDNDPYTSAIVVNPDHQKTHQAIKAYMLSGSNIFIPSKPRWRVSLAFNKAQSLLQNNVLPLQAGDPLFVDIRYNPVVERYIVFNASKRLDASRLSTQHHARNDLFNPQIEVVVHKVDVRPIPRCYGYFSFGNNNNLVYDVNGYLAHYYNDNGDPQAAAIASTSNIPIEFIYVDPGERDITQLVVYSAENAIEYDMMQKQHVGLCIADGELYCPSLHFMVFKSPEASLIGEWYDFKIVELNHDSRSATVDPLIIPDRKKVRSRLNNNAREFLFNIERVHPAAIYIATGLGPIGLSDAQYEVMDRKTAASVVFPLLHQNPYIRPNVRAIVKTGYKTFEDGIRMGGFK